MADTESIVVVGAGHAGGRAAQALRAAGFEGRVVLVGEETYPPYERPPLSKELLTGDDGIERARLHQDAFYEEQNIELHLGATASEIDRGAQRVRLSDGEALAYDKLMLTTGARVRPLPVPGTDLPGVHYLRTYDDTEVIRAGLRRHLPVVVVGGGFIGLECAASARQRGCAVTVLEATDRLMGRAVAPEIGRYYVDLHTARGVDLRLGARIAAIEGEESVARVVLEDGAVEAAMVVIGIGILPNVELAAEAGLEIDNGIVVDACGRTSDPAIYAAGDVVSQPHPTLAQRVRLESYQNAQDQAMAVARNMVGEPRPYVDSLWVWSDQYDVNLQMTGFPDDHDALVFRGEPKNGPFTLFYMKDGRIRAVNTVNNGREMRPAQRLMQSGKVIDPDVLADPEVKLIKLTKA